jgi:deferrochelatase/peroxidase EfeB
MSDGDQPSPSRRLFLGAAGGLLAAAATCPCAASAGGADRIAKGIAPAGQGAGKSVIEPFQGAHQGGITTSLQNHTYFAAFDIRDTHDNASQSGYGGKSEPVRPVTRGDIASLMKAWTAAAARLSQGRTAAELDANLAVAAVDSGEALGLAPARLTLTFGFGPGLFVRDGNDRFGLAARRPAALVDLPKFHGDQLIPARTGGDLSVQACADDPQVAFHAVRELARLGDGIVQLRWVQSGFSSNYAAKDTPRNLMGFKDGTQNPKAEPAHETTAATRGRTVTGAPSDMDRLVWVGAEGPDWMRGGSYLVTRRIRIALEHWDRTDVAFQQQVIGRRKYDGAPLGGKSEFDPLDLAATDTDGNPVIPENAHTRLASASVSGTQILRRGYSYNDGISFIAERWPPWRQAMEYDAGLLFVCYQRDPREGFIKMFRTMATVDALNQFVTHTGGGLFACPGGVSAGQYIGQGLFEAKA